MKKYQWDADVYSQFSSAQQKWARESITRVDLRKYEHVLDVGCGDGKVTAEIAQYVPEGSVVGVDNSEEMISLASEKFPHPEYPNLSFKVADAKNLNFNNEFDVVLSNAVLHWIDDHVKVLKGMYRCLKNNGRILLQMGGKGNVPEAFFVLDKMVSHPEWEKYFKEFEFPYYFYSAGEYREFFSQTDFKNIKIELVEKDMQHKDKDSMIGWIRTTWLPYTQRIPEEKREIFIEELFNEFSKNFPADKDGTFHAKAKRLIVEANK